MPLADAKANVENWWAQVNPQVAQATGHRSQQALNEQIQRLALDRTHRLVTEHKLSDADALELSTFALRHCEPPRVKPAPPHIEPQVKENPSSSID